METKQASMGVDDNCPIQPPNSTPRTPSPCASVCPSECVPARAERVKPVREKIVLSWSGGKDSSMAAYHLLTSQKYEIVSLMTTVTEGFAEYPCTASGGNSWRRKLPPSAGRMRRHA